jgi:UDP-N-acetylglucosamine 2-epimerase (non-hydrolysing)
MTILGTRPELTKMSCVIPEFDKSFDHEFVFTNQHYDRNMVDVFLEELGIREPDELLNVRDSSQTELESAILAHIEAKGSKCKQVIVFGDTNTCMAGARAAKKAGKTLIHIEAGARSFDLSMPEERNRIEVDKMSDHLFAHSALCAENLRKEGVRGKVVDTGNPGVDAVMAYSKKARPIAPKLGLKKGGFILLTLHRQDTTDTPGLLESFLDSLGKLDHTFLFPVHPRTRKRLADYVFPKNIKTTEPLGYFDFLGALKDSLAIVSDSGGVQLEAVTLGVPCFVARRSTEYWEALNAGAVRLFGLDPELLSFNLKLLSSAPFPKLATNPYGKGDSAKRIAKALEAIVS